jgi:mono/diheme cytochrome c family protein
MQEHEKFLNIFTRAATFGLMSFVMLANIGLALAQPSEPGKNADLRPTAVAGESWLQHLRRSFDETSMGKTGRLGPPELSAEDESLRQITVAPRQFEDQNKTVTLHGSDLYRMNCRGCHGENGAGAPPEINSVINPVRATSALLMMERVRAAGMTMSRADVAKLAAQSRTMLLDRLHHGGQDMPAFPHLSRVEVNSLVAYLRQLAGVPGAANEQLAVREERMRVGEHIAKSTCHVCHSAAGANPTAQQLYAGAIPPLSTLVLRTSPAQFVRKITQGAPIMMGAPPQMLRGRMPVFYYLSEEEAENVYLYLTSYPPYSYEPLEAVTVGSGPTLGADADPTALAQVQPPIPLAPFAEAAEVDKGLSQTTPAEEQVTILAALLGLLANMVLCLGFWFSVRELRRLSGDSEGAPLRAESGVESAGRLDVELAA